MCYYNVGATFKQTERLPKVCRGRFPVSFSLRRVVVRELRLHDKVGYNATNLNTLEKECMNVLRARKRATVSRRDGAA